MIAKIVKGSSFKGVVNYILDKGKDAKILVCDGLFCRGQGHDSHELRGTIKDESEGNEARRTHLVGFS